jgi:hypothetical protein
MMEARLGINAAFSTASTMQASSEVLAVILAVMAIDAGLATTLFLGKVRNGGI